MAAVLALAAASHAAYPAQQVHSIKVHAGRFECLRVEPFIEGDALFKVKGKSMHIYLTNDERKMPIMIRSKVFIGAVDVELTDYVLPGEAAE